jgi:ATP-dependent helicase/nuclease subunit A
VNARDLLVDDALARKTALDPTQSFIVQAPAGSGKTELLIQRMLSLLARVEHPSEILAITFTKKAAGEMRERLFAALEAARETDEPAKSPERERWQLAREVIRRDAEKAWRIADRPALFNIETFDAFSLRITKLAPLSIDGATAGLATLAQDASVQHREAARRALLDPSDAQSLRAAATLLSALDNRVDDIIALLADLLGKRAQWMDHLIDDSDEAIAQMREIIVQSVKAELASTSSLWPTSMSARVCALSSHAAENVGDEEKKLWLSRLAAFDFKSHDIDDLQPWIDASKFLITASSPNGWRKSYNKNDGFPAASEKGISAEEKEGRAEAKEAITSLLADFTSLDQSEALRQSLLRTRALPDTAAITAHEPILRAALRVLKLASAELLLIERGAAITDFSGVALAAKHALLNFRDEVFGRLDAKIAHILVDEFQDTNPAQAALIESLVDDWTTQSGRTLFLVGDPMQSIYGFRDADVGIFIDAWERGVADLALNRLTLSANYRSQRTIVDWVNETMRDVFARAGPHQSTARVSFAQAVATRDKANVAEPGAAIHVFADRPTEVQNIIADIARVRAKSPMSSVAIIVRAKSHATEILQALQTAQLSFEAREMARWHHRPLIRDLMSLTYVLAQPSDRLSWYAWLRSPMIGLSLATFAALSDAQQTRRSEMPAPLFDTEFSKILDAEEAQRISIAVNALDVAAKLADLGQLAERVYAVFRFCGGDMIARTSHERAEVEDYLAFLDEHCSDGFLPPRDAFERALRDRFQSFASTANAATSVSKPSTPIEILTIHKAKGLEWDYVYLPQWNRRSPAEKRHLVVWNFVRQSHKKLGDNLQSSNGYSRTTTQLLVAAKETRRKSENSVFQFVQDRRVAARKEEAKRLLYVAVTRAREGLFISGSESSGGAPPHVDSLAALMNWPVSQANNDAASIETLATLSKRRIMTKSLLRFEPPLSVAPTQSIAPKIFSKSRNAFDETIEANDSSRANEIAFGIVGHKLIEGLANAKREGRDYSPKAETIERRLIREGVARERAKTDAYVLLQAVRTMASSEHFAFIHDATHIEAADELPLAISAGSETQALRIDRTFIAKDGTRWIIDYKFATPPTTEHSATQFTTWLNSAVKRYRDQLDVYQQAFSRIDPIREIKIALYLPTVDRLLVMETK